MNEVVDVHVHSTKNINIRKLLYRESKGTLIQLLN